MKDNMFVIESPSGKLLDVLHLEELSFISELHTLTVTPLDEFTADRGSMEDVFGDIEAAYIEPELTIKSDVEMDVIPF